MRLGANARRGLSRPAAAAVDAAGHAVALLLAGAAAARRGKAVHPHGIVFDAELVVGDAPAAVRDAELFAAPGRRPALVRFSRSLGLPRPLPDLLGISVRVPDAYGAGRHQDLLAVTCFDAPVANRLFVPARDVQQRPYSASLPHRIGDRSWVFGVLPRPESPRPRRGTELERVAEAAATGRLVFDLAIAGRAGRFRPVAELRVGARLPGATDALRFDPWNSGGGLEPAGVLNRLRDYAYPLSQRAWARAGGAGAQAAAEASVRRRTGGRAG